MSRDGAAGRSDRRSAALGRRGQFVLLAAGVIAVGLLPVVLATLQLGFAADLEAASGPEGALADARRALAPAVHRAAAGIPANHSWADRDAAAATVLARLDPAMTAVERGRLEAGTVQSVRANQSAASRWAGAACPGGPNRQFGDCEAHRGVVLQARAGRTHVVGVAVDLRVTGPDRTAEATLWLWAVPRG